MRPMGRQTAMVTGVAALAILVAAGFLGRDRMVEEWQIRKLDSGDFAERFRAALKLGEMRSTKAIPKLVALLKQSDDHSDDFRKAFGVDIPPGNLMMNVFHGIGDSAAPALIEALSEKYDPRKMHRWRGWACFALGTMKVKEAVPAIVDVLQRDRDPPTKLTACISLVTMGSDIPEAMDALEAASKDPEIGKYAEQAIEVDRLTRDGSSRDGER
jgi:HEAT repeat protein